MSDYIERDRAIDAVRSYYDEQYALCDSIEELIEKLPSADVQPVTYCKDCQWCADVKDVDTLELYHVCGILGAEVPDGFACNHGKRKGADNEVD